MLLRIFSVAIVTIVLVFSGLSSEAAYVTPPKIDPVNQTVNSGSVAKMSFFTPAGVVKTHLMVTCPTGLTIAYGAKANICNTLTDLSFPALSLKDIQLKVVNSTASVLKAAVNFRIYQADRPNYPISTSAEITVNTGQTGGGGAVAHKIDPAQVTVNPGAVAKMTFGTPPDAVKTSMIVHCPAGLTIAYGSAANICNTTVNLSFPANSRTEMPFKVTNITANALKAAAHFYVYPAGNPQYAKAATGEITVNGLAPPQDGPTIAPAEITANSGDTVTMIFGTPPNAAATRLWMSCPPGLMVGYGTTANICNTYVNLSLPANSRKELQFKVINTNLSYLKAGANFAAFKADRSSYGGGVQGTILVIGSVISPKMTPSAVTVNSGEKAKIGFFTPPDAVRTTLLMTCPPGLTIGYGATANICNAETNLSLPAYSYRNLEFTVVNKTASVLKVLPQFRIFRADKPTYPVGTSGEITVNTGKSAVPVSFKIDPAQVTVDSGTAAKMTFGTPPDAVRTEMMINCPTGMTVGYGATANICNSLVNLSFAANSLTEMPFKATNITASALKAEAVFYVYRSANPNNVNTAKGEITVKGIAPPKTDPTLAPASVQILSGEVAKLTFGTTPDTVRATLYASCPAGLVVAYGTTANICNTQFTLPIPAGRLTEVPLKATNSNLHDVKARLNYYVYKAANPRVAAGGVQGEINVAGSRLLPEISPFQLTVSSGDVAKIAFKPPADAQFSVLTMKCPAGVTIAYGTTANICNTAPVTLPIPASTRRELEFKVANSTASALKAVAEFGIYRVGNPNWPFTMSAEMTVNPVKVVPASHRIEPVSVTAGSGTIARMTFFTPADAVNTKLYMSCPTGLTIGYGKEANICKTWIDLSLPANSTREMPFTVANSTPSALKAVVGFYLYQASKPNFANGIQGEIIVNAVAPPKTDPAIEPAKVAVNSGAVARMTFKTPADTVRTEVRMQCPAGMKIGYEKHADICNVWMIYPLPAGGQREIPFTVSNNTASALKAAVEFRIYRSGSPNAPQSATAEMTVAGIQVVPYKIDPARVTADSGTVVKVTLGAPPDALKAQLLMICPSGLTIGYGTTANICNSSVNLSLPRNNFTEIQFRVANGTATALRAVLNYLLYRDGNPNRVNRTIGEIIVNGGMPRK